MKKKILIILCVLLIIPLVISVSVSCSKIKSSRSGKSSGCDDEYTGHVCRFVDVPVKNATCTEEGYTAHKKCAYCGKTVGGEVIPVIPHDFSVVEYPAKVATCTETGYTATMRCSVCDEIKQNEVLPLIPHDFSVVEYPAKVATCTEEGYTAIMKCSVCDEIKQNEVLPLKSHNISYSFAFDDESHFHPCVNCDYVYGTENHIFVLKHNEDCHWNRCACGYRQVDEIHTFVDDVCTVCGYIRNYKRILTRLTEWTIMKADNNDKFSEKRDFNVSNFFEFRGLRIVFSDIKDLEYIICFYDENKQYISETSVIINSEFDIFAHTVPFNAIYARIYVNLDDNSFRSSTLLNERVMVEVLC